MSIEVMIAIALTTSVLATSLVFYMLTKAERNRKKVREDLERSMRQHPAGKKLFTEEEVIFNDYSS